jgi:hypothetical protein
MDRDLRRNMDLRRRLADLMSENSRLRGQNDQLVGQLNDQKDRNVRLAERIRVNNLMRIAALRLRIPQEQVMERFYRWYDQQVMGHTGGQDE